MPLFSLDRGVYRIQDLPHEREFDVWRSRLREIDFEAIVNELNSRIDSDEIHTAGWIPGSDWTGTVWEPIYYACGQDIEASGMFFGLIVFYIMMNREDCWGFGRYEKDGLPIESMTYFRIECPST